MAKYELPLYNMETEEVEKTLQRNKLPVGLYIKYQEFTEKLTGDEIKKDVVMFSALKDLVCETFPELTAEDYMNKCDPAEVLALFGAINNKATTLSGNSKNA